MLWNLFVGLAKNWKQFGMTKKRPTTSPIAKPASADIKKLQNQVDELMNALKLERADTTNLRRHYDDQLANLRQSVKASLILELLPVIDNFERALKHLPKELEKNEYIRGVQQIAKQFDKVLVDLGVTKIKTVGQEFDPFYHEAVSLEEGTGHREIVSQEISAGYLLNGAVLRPATVKVSSQ